MFLECIFEEHFFYPISLLVLHEIKKVSKNKLRKFSELLSLPNVYQCFDWHNPVLHGAGMEEVPLKGNWKKLHFKNENPITLELACGGGEYTVNLSRMYPNRNFIGLDVKGARIWKGATKANSEKLSNAAFLRCRIEQIYEFFEPEEIDEIWITFPDPFLRDSKENRRLTSAFFLKQYRKILKSGGIVQLKTDSTPLYDFTMETIKADDKCELLYHEKDIYSKPLIMPELEFKTYYEGMHLAKGLKIKFVRIKLHI